MPQARWRIFRIASSCATRDRELGFRLRDLLARSLVLHRFLGRLLRRLRRRFVEILRANRRVGEDRDPRRLDFEEPALDEDELVLACPGILMRTAPGLICVSSGACRG